LTLNSTRDYESQLIISRRASALIITASVVVFSIPLYLNWGLGALEDDLIWYYPSLVWLGRCLRSGVFPLWNPDVYAGYPVVGDPQGGIFYPPNYLFAILPGPLAYSMTITLHYWLAGFGMYRLARTWKLARSSATLGALAWMFCGFLVGHRTHLTMLASASWLTVIFWFWTKVIHGGFHRYFWLTIVAQALQFFAGHIQMVILTSTISLLYVLIYPPRSRLRFVYLWLLHWLVAFGLAGVILAGAVELLTTSVRVNNSYSFFTQNSFFPMAWPIVIAPAVMGLRVPNFLYQYQYFGPWHHCEMNCFTGIVVLALALSIVPTVLHRGRDRRILTFLSIVAVLGIFLALGRHNPFFKLLFSIPLYRSLRCPARHLLWFNFAIASLAMFGLERLRNRATWQDARRVALIAVAATLILIVYLVICKLLVMVHDFSRLLPARGEHVLPSVYQALNPLNPAILIPCTITTALVVITRYASSRRLIAALIALAVIELATIVPFYDVNLPPRRVLAHPPDVARALERLEPDGRKHFILPLTLHPYRKPLENLQPFCNLLFDRATLTGYGPLLYISQRKLFGWELWPTSSRYLDVLTRADLLARMGVTFVIAEPEIAEQIEYLKNFKTPNNATSPRLRDHINVDANRPASIPLAGKPGLYRLNFRARTTDSDDLQLACRIGGIDDSIWSDQKLYLNTWDINEHWQRKHWSFFIPAGLGADPKLTITSDRANVTIEDIKITPTDSAVDWLRAVWRSKNGTVIYRNTNSKGRIYFANRARWVDSLDELQSGFLRPWQDTFHKMEPEFD